MRLVVLELPPLVESAPQNHLSVDQLLDDYRFLVLANYLDHLDQPAQQHLIERLLLGKPAGKINPDFSDKGPTAQPQQTG